MEGESSKTVIIAGGGPAGITLAYELATRSEIKPILFEEDNTLGGLSRTVCHNGNRIDIGGHRFFSKDEGVMQWWLNLLPLQTSPAKDEVLPREKEDSAPSHNPETSDKVMLRRRRVSRIYYLQRFFDYPVTLSFKTFRALGLFRTIKAGLGYLLATIHKRKEKSLEDFYINRFGKPLYRMFFEGYTQKVWGKHPSGLGADWGSQRIKGLSLVAVIKDVLGKNFHKTQHARKVETSLIEEFFYPKYGPGQMWEIAAGEAEKHGAEIHTGTKVKKVIVNLGQVVAVVTEDAHHNEQTTECDFFASSMPLKDLIASLEGIEIPEDVKAIASSLPYRDFIMVGLLVDNLNIKNQTRLKTFADRIPDTWIYVQEGKVRLGRIQIFNNWSPYLVKDFENKMWIGLEYFCNEGDAIWRMNDEEFTAMAIDELVSIGIIDASAVEDSVCIKVKKAYPAYYGSYYSLDKVREFLDSIPNLFCIGRNGQHRYNNMDHSMLTAMKTAEVILSGSSNRTPIWNVNTESTYHERK